MNLKDNSNMNWEYYDKKINKKTKNRYDLTPLFSNSKVFKNLITDMTKLTRGLNIDKIAGLDALGFIIGAAMAHKIGLGFITIRKEGKLPGKKDGLTFTDYTGKNKKLELAKNTVKKGEKILLVDDWIETGTQIKTAIKLIEKQGGKIVGIRSIAAEKKKETKTLFEKYDCKAIKIIE